MNEEVCMEEKVSILKETDAEQCELTDVSVGMLVNGPLTRAIGNLYLLENERIKANMSLAMDPKTTSYNTIFSDHFSLSLKEKPQF